MSHDVSHRLAQGKAQGVKMDQLEGLCIALRCTPNDLMALEDKDPIMPRRKIIPYKPYLKELARRLRNNSTRSEIKLWMELKGKKIHGFDFHRQKPLDNFIADFYCAELSLCIELDGYTHQFDEVKIKDRIKEERLAELGLTVLRFNDDEVMDDINNVIRTIECYIEAFQHTPTSQQGGGAG